LANWRSTHYRQSTNSSLTVGWQIPYGGEIIIAVLAFNRYNLLNVARARSQNSWLKMMETTHCYNLTEWSSFKERCLQKWSPKLEKSLHVLQFPLEYLLSEKPVFLRPIARCERKDKTSVVIFVFKLGWVDFIYGQCFKKWTTHLLKAFYWYKDILSGNFLCAKIFGGKFPSLSQTKIWLLTCDSSHFLVTMTSTTVTCCLWAQKQKQTCGHTILK